MLKALHVMNLSLFEPQIAEIRLRLAIVNLNRNWKIKQNYCSKNFFFVVKSKEKKSRGTKKNHRQEQASWSVFLPTWSAS